MAPGIEVGDSPHARLKGRLRAMHPKLLLSAQVALGFIRGIIHNLQHSPGALAQQPVPQQLSIRALVDTST